MLMTQWLAAAATLALPTEAAAQDPITITGSRVGATTGYSAVDEEEIARRSADTLLETLNDLAGIRAFSTGGDAGGSFVSIRGGEPNFTLVLVEGIRLNNPTNSRGGAFDFFGLDPQAIDAVEVSRGAGSPVYGSDALAGVVNLRLRAPATPGLTAGVRASVNSEGNRNAGVMAGLGWSSGGLNADIGRHVDHALDDGSELERTQAVAHAQQRLGGFSARATGLYSESDFLRFPEDSGGPRLAVNRALEVGRQEIAAIGLTIRRDAVAAVRPALSLSYTDQSDDLDTPAIAPGVLDPTPPLTTSTRFRRFEGVAEVGVRRGRITASGGVALIDERGTSEGVMMIGFPVPTGFRQDRTTFGAFAEARAAVSDAVTIDLGMRHDRFGGGADSTSASAAASLRLSPGGSSLFGRIASGYKLPSFYALSHPLVGNPDLSPEHSRTIEGGIVHPWDRGSLRATLFANRYRDLVDFDPATFSLVNRDRVRVRGVELEGRLQPARTVSLRAALTYLDLEPSTLRGRPSWQGNVRGAWQASPRLELNAALRGNSRVFDSSIPTGPIFSDGHVEFDLGLQYRLSPNARITLSGRNLTDARFEDAVGFPSPGRMVRIGLRIGAR